MYKYIYILKNKNNRDLNEWHDACALSLYDHIIGIN